MTSPEVIYQNLIEAAHKKELAKCLQHYERQHPQIFELVENILDLISERKRTHKLFTTKELQLIAQQMYLLIAHDYC